MKSIEVVLKDFTIEQLKEYIEQQERSAPSILLAERFSTVSGQTGLLISMPSKASLSSFAKELDTTDKNLRSMKATEFLARLFVTRGGKVWSSLTNWNTMEYAIPGLAGTSAWTVGEVLGLSWFVIVSTEQDVETGKGLSYNDCVSQGIRLLSPVEWLLLVFTSPDIADTSTYPAKKYWEWIGAITPTYAASGFSYSDGLLLYWVVPGRTGVDCRARSVLA